MARAEDEEVDLSRTARLALAAWAALLLPIGLFVGELVRHPRRHLDVLYAWGPITSPHNLLAGLFEIALGVTVCLGWLAWRPRRRGALVRAACTLAVTVMVANIARERAIIGDWGDYVEAAAAMAKGAPLPDRYIYPPLFATGLSWVLTPFGLFTTIWVIFVLSHLSIPVFHQVASRLLERTGLSVTLSSVLVASSLVVNAPVLRHIGYAQVNLLLLDLVVGGVLLYGTRAGVSGALFALGAHLKVVPLLWVPPLLHPRRLAWVGGFAAMGAAVVALTGWSTGLERYPEAMANLLAWRATELRSASLYGLLVETARVTGWEPPVDRIFDGVRGVGALAVYGLAWRAAHTMPLVRTGDPHAARAINMLLPLMFLWPVLSPVVWVHHLLVVLLPALLCLLRVASLRALAVCVFGYGSVFLLPAFDVYPWSFVRLLGWWTLLGLTAQVVWRGTPMAPWVERVERALEAGWRSLAAT